jgi:hypothetical protein
MEMKKINKSMKKLVGKAYQKGFDDGWDDGWFGGIQSVSADLSEPSFEDGVAAERKRIVGMFEMLSAMNMENGSANKAKQYYEAAQLIKVADEMAKYDWSDEGVAEMYQEELDKDGF